MRNTDTENTVFPSRSNHQVNGFISERASIDAVSRAERGAISPLVWRGIGTAMMYDVFLITTMCRDSVVFDEDEVVELGRTF